MRHIKAFIYIPSIAFLFLSNACEKAVLTDDPGHDPINVFDALWQDLDNRYSYFNVKSIDWDSVRTVYRPKVQMSMTEIELVDLLADMLFVLKDGHVNLQSSFDRSRNWTWFLDYPPNFNPTIIERTYLGTTFRQMGPFRVQTIDDNVYAYYGSFASTIEETHLDALLELAEGKKGIIVDIRNNGGGSLQNARRIASCFIDKPYVYARSRIKTGPGENDFSGWKNLIIEPREGKKHTGNVVVLTNRNCYSAANSFAQMASVLPNTVLIGSQTGGGGGTPVYAELPNGWIYRFSATQTINPEGEHIEFGVPVDVEANLTIQDELAGIDTVIETALNWLDDAYKKN